MISHTASLNISLNMTSELTDKAQGLLLQIPDYKLALASI